MLILSIDGGGIRGVVASEILSRLETGVPSLIKNTDVFAGTSTGGIIALGLASGLKPSDMTLLYFNHGNNIFKSSWFQRIKDLWGLSGSKYDTKPLKHALVSAFGNKTVGDLTKKVVIPTFKLNTVVDGSRQWFPNIIHNFTDKYHKLSLVDVALRTSAAPSFFPSYQGCIDGGVCANNPSLAALSQCIDENNSIKTKIQDIKLLSIGTGSVNTHIEKSPDWGVVKWVPSLINIMLDGSADLAHYYCKQLLEDTKYRRIDPTLKRDIPLDDIKSIVELAEIGANYKLDGTISWLKDQWS